MAVIQLVSLVLRGDAVLCGGLAVELRRGTGYPAAGKAPVSLLSMRHPSPAPLAGFVKPDQRPDHGRDRQVVVANEAGRPRSQASSLRRCLGGPCLTAATSSTLSVRLSASVSENGPTGPEVKRCWSHTTRRWLPEAARETGAR